MLNHSCRDTVHMRESPWISQWTQQSCSFFLPGTAPCLCMSWVSANLWTPASSSSLRTDVCTRCRRSRSPWAGCRAVLGSAQESIREQGHGLGYPPGSFLLFSTIAMCSLGLILCSFWLGAPFLGVLIPSGVTYFGLLERGGGLRGWFPCRSG